MIDAGFDPSSLYTEDSKFWQRDDEFNRVWMARSKTPIFCSAAPRLMDAAPRKVNLLKYLKLGMQRAYGKDWVWYPNMQWRGTCVGQSHQTIARGTMSINSILDGTKYPGDPCVAACYAGGRVDVGRQPGRWDGSNGGWTQQWLTDEGGILLGAEVGLPDGALSEQAYLDKNRKDEQLAVSWTASREGVPKDMETKAKVHPIKGSAMVLTVEEVNAALSNLQFTNICTSLIPDKQRSEHGVSRMRRRGGHSTVIFANDGPSHAPYGYLQSWWHYFSGPGPYQDQYMKEFNSSVCYISEAELRSVLSSRDCFTFWGVQGLDPVSDSYLL